jgi:hypothetical protein
MHTTTTSLWKRWTVAFAGAAVFALGTASGPAAAAPHTAGADSTMNPSVRTRLVDMLPPSAYVIDRQATSTIQLHGPAEPSHDAAAEDRAARLTPTPQRSTSHPTAAEAHASVAVGVLTIASLAALVSLAARRRATRFGRRAARAATRS